jgi:putative Ca2+/H+ antiporter (TMEM165/GDT1 family)
MKPNEGEQLQQEVEYEVDNLHKKISKRSKDSAESPEATTPTMSNDNNASSSSGSEANPKKMVNQLFSSIHFWKSNQPKTQGAPNAQAESLKRSDSKISIKQTPMNERSVEEGHVIYPEEQLQTSKQKFLTLLKIFINTFGLIFIAEWGDRSQLATIVLASTNNVGGIILGSIIGHTICSLLAVIAGALVAGWISVRVLTVIGGVVFIGFAITSLAIGFDNDDLEQIESDEPL